MKTFVAPLLLASLASADFLIYSAQQAAFVEPSMPLLGELLVFRGPPSCSDANNKVPLTTNPNNDASRGGYATSKDDNGDLTRLEMYDGSDHPITNQAFGAITLYRQAGSKATFDLKVKSGAKKGTCQYFPNKPHPDSFECSDGLGSSNGFQMFACKAAGVSAKD